MATSRRVKSLIAAAAPDLQSFFAFFILRARAREEGRGKEEGVGGKEGGGAMDAKFDMERILAGDKEEIERARRLIFRLQGSEVITIFCAVEGSLCVPGHPTADRTAIFASFYNSYLDRNKNPPPDLPLPDSTAEYEDLVQEDIASGLAAERERKKKKKKDTLDHLDRALDILLRRRGTREFRRSWRRRSRSSWRKR